MLHFEKFMEDETVSFTGKKKQKLKIVQSASWEQELYNRNEAIYPSGNVKKLVIKMKEMGKALTKPCPFKGLGFFNSLDINITKRKRSLILWS